MLTLDRLMAAAPGFEPMAEICSKVLAFTVHCGIPTTKCGAWQVGAVWAIIPLAREMLWQVRLLKAMSPEMTQALFEEAESSTVALKAWPMFLAPLVGDTKTEALSALAIPAMLNAITEAIAIVVILFIVFF